MSQHYVLKCKCGVILSQCRCMGEKVERISQEECRHQPAES